MRSAPGAAWVTASTEPIPIAQRRWLAWGHANSADRNVYVFGTIGWR